MPFHLHFEAALITGSQSFRYDWLIVTWLYAGNIIINVRIRIFLQTLLCAHNYIYVMAIKSWLQSLRVSHLETDVGEQMDKEEKWIFSQVNSHVGFCLPVSVCVCVRTSVGEAVSG